MSLTQKITTKTWIATPIVESIITLIEEGNTIPFIARYRKEMTGGATDEQLRDFEEIYLYQQKLLQKKEDILRLLTEKEVITDELREAIAKAETLSQLDDIYRPYKDKKNTRATKALAKWLKPLADILLVCEMPLANFQKHAETFVKDTWDIKTTVNDTDEAIQWAMDIVAEIIADHPELRATIKEQQGKKLQLITSPTKNFEENSVYETYREYSKSLHSIPNYAYLAIARAEKEKQLKVSLQFQEKQSITEATNIFVPRDASDLQELLLIALTDALKRLLHPSLERELRSAKKEQSDREAIDIFGKNVEELLLSSPVRWKTIMWFDPAYRTGCKLAIIDHTGKYIASDVIYPTRWTNDVEPAKKTLLALIQKYDIELICIGNGTASRESETFVAQLIKKHKLETKYLVVSEAWASVYSASKLATHEYPDLDVTIRGAINIAQRVQDPLSTYVKIDPKSLGVGQYQHDVDQTKLKKSLDTVVESCVNAVGVNINTASEYLLSYVAGIGPKIAANIVAYRSENGGFTSRTDIKKVPRLGGKAFEQAAGFLRIKNGKNPLDNSGVHPESYKLVDKIAKDLHSKIADLINNKDLIKKINLQNYISATVGLPTLQDIVKELEKPGLDPREKAKVFSFDKNIKTIDDLRTGQLLPGIVNNITNFGCFVDIGIKESGLIHVSNLSDTFVKDVNAIVSLQQQIIVKVLEVDVVRKRIQLALVK